MNLELIAITGIPEVETGADLVALVGDAMRDQGFALRDGDVVVIAQKIVSKAEGAVRRLSDVAVSDAAMALATRLGGDPRRIQVVLNESVRTVRSERALIVETRHGFVCANAGVDNSNVPDEDIVTVLPDDSDASAAALRRGFRVALGADVGIIVSDTFGRPWRNGICNVALGVAGMPALLDYRGGTDDFGVQLTATVVAVADELAGAAEIVMGKTNRVPVVVVRGFESDAPHGTGQDLLRAAAEDLFR